jgi:hypothetical protein
VPATPSQLGPQDESAEGSQEDILLAAVAALTDADAPPDEDDYARWPDPEYTPSGELAALTDAEFADLLAGPPPAPAPLPGWPLTYLTPAASLRPGAAETGGGWPWPAGFEPRDGSGGGLGFADGGALDVLAPGLALAGFADDACAQLDGLEDDSLIGVLRAWRRLTSWAQARELAVTAALAGRRPADGSPPAAPGQLPGQLSEFIGAEVAAALTLTGQAADGQVGLALALAGRPATAAALEGGQIDLPRAEVLIGMLGPLTPAHADAVEAAVLPRAPGLTTGQLRAALGRAILAIDPDAARRRREQAEQAARVEHWAEPEGTATLTGRHLPPAQVLAASKRLTQIATRWKKLGAAGGMDLLRAHAYLALLNGLPTDTPPASLLPLPAPGPGKPSPDSQPGPDGGPVPGDQLVPAGLRRPGADELPPLAGLVSLTIPLTTLMRLGDAPGAAAGYGPLDADTARLLACALAGHRATRWQVIVTAPDGQALAAGTARGPATPARPSQGGAGGQAGQGGQGSAGDSGPGCGWTVRVTAEPIAAGQCDHRNAEPGYRPSPALQRLIRARTTTCTGPGCRRPAARCDLDHTLAYEDGGITCECDLAPLCRFCHRLKQSQGWTLQQPSPGLMIWVTPAGRKYVILPTEHTA